MKKNISFLLIVCASLVSLLFFHNCGKMTRIESSSVNTLSCIQTKMAPAFKKTYFNFFANSGCRSCHAPGSEYPNIAQFADPNISIGLNAFSKVGPTKVKNKLKITHNGYSWEQFQAELSSHEVEWKKAIRSYGCDIDPNVTPEKTISFYEPSPSLPKKNRIKSSMKTPQTLTWDLSSRIPGVSISVDIQANGDDFDFPMHFSVNNFQVLSNRHNIRIGEITVLINHEDYSNTTFKELNESVMKGTSFSMIGSEGATSLITRDEGESYENTDGWSLKIDLLEIMP